jgi:DsbC/DsbD-like thiol-disulfide interchange protein
MLGLALICAACGDKQAARPNIPTDASPQATPAISRKLSSADVVKVSVPNAEITGGRSAQANVRIVVSQGYHINANPPTFPYLIATKVEASESKGITIGTPVYPAPLTKTFSFAKKPLAVYEGETAINLPLQAARDAAKGARVIPLVVRVQACDDSTCYPPAKIDLSLNLTVK